MVLSDQEITLCVQNDRVIENYDPDCLTNFGYDVRAKYFAVDQRQNETFVLRSGESVFVAAEETVRIPLNMICRVVLKNSRIRQGFAMDAPVYQPGHHTRIFFRLTNITGNEIRLYAGEKYATIMFEQLSSETASPYQGAFTDELDFSGLSGYKGAYERQIRKIEEKTEDLKTVEHTIYSNVLVILTVFVALFSFLTANVSFFSKDPTLRNFIIGDFLMIGGISFLSMLIHYIICEDHRKPHFLHWIPSILFFVIALLLFLFT